MAQSAFVIGRYDWAKNRGGRGEPTVRPRSGRHAKAMGNVRGLPQIVFKVVPNGGCKGPKGLTAQLDYVLGKADHIIDPNKEFDRLDHLPVEFSEAMARDWAEGWDRRVASGHSMHMIASFPIGTDPAKVAEIMRATCYEVFDQGNSRFNYIAAVHTDKGHPHAHIIVDRRNAEGEWFYFARNGEFTYDRVKDAIVEHAAAWGVELVNTSKLSRGITTGNASERGTNPAAKGLTGKLVDFGQAPYQNKATNSKSFFVTIETSFGPKTVWGKEIANVLHDAGASRGDKVCLTHEGKVPVTVQDRKGNYIEVHRNQWALDLPERGISVRTNNDRAASQSEARSVEWKQQKVQEHAAEYQALASAYSGAFPALARGFAAAAAALKAGQELMPNLLDRRMPMVQSAEASSAGEGANTSQPTNRPAERASTEEPLSVSGGAGVNQLRREGRSATYISERNIDFEDRARVDLGTPSIDHERELEQMATESIKAMAIIQESRDKLAEVRETIPDLLPQDRPAVEAQYFSAVRDLDYLTTGTAHSDYSDPARGTIYADGSRDALASMDQPRLETSLAGTGIDPAEVAARANVEARTAALEAHWVAMDAQSIAEERGYDMATEDGARQAYDDLAATYRGIAEERSDELTIPVITGDGERLELTVAEIRTAAERDPGLRLEDPENGAELVPSDENLAAVKEFREDMIVEGRINAAIIEEEGDAHSEQEQDDFDKWRDEQAIPLSEHPIFGDRDLSEVVEDREAMLAEARELASRDTLTVEQQERLMNLVERVAGKDAVHELRAGNTAALASVLPDQGQRLDVAQKFLEAEKERGLDRDDALAVVSLEREQRDLNAEIERAKELDRTAETQRQQRRDEGHEL